ncbi:MAG: NFACT family protein [Clostridia bacterium]|nr:NFACT family protein [Clostridia bacterium]
MTLDAVLLERIKNELNVLIGGKINKIAQPEKDEIVLSLYQKANFNLLISSNASNNRIHLTTKPFENPKIALGFCMLLRKHLVGATLVGIWQMPFERVLDFDFEGKNELGYPTKCHLICEFTAKTANIILTDGDYVIFDTLKHLPQDLNSSRITLAGAKYQFFQPQNKIAPDDANSVVSLLQSPLPQIDLLSQNLLGISQKNIQEALYQNPTSPLLCATALQQFLQKVKSGKANVVYRNGQIFELCPFDYLSIGGQKVFFNSFNQACDEFFYMTDKQSRFKSKAKSVNTVVKNAIGRTQKKIAIQGQALLDANNFDSTKKMGDLLLANLYKIKPGDEKVVVDDFYSEDCPKLEIALDKRYSPQKNAQIYYKKYQKQKSSLEYNTKLLEENKKLLAYLETIKSNLSFCTEQSDLEEIVAELSNLGLIKKQSKDKKATTPSGKPMSFNIDGWTLLVGKNNIQNDNLTKSASPDDMWLHTQKIHSSHCIIQNPNKKKIPENVIVISAEICAFYSQAQQGGKVAVDYTQKKNVKKPSKSMPGFVNYLTYYSVIVQPCAHSELLNTN